MFKRIPLETKNEIVRKVKNGLSVSEAAKLYAVSTKTITHPAGETDRHLR